MSSDSYIKKRRIRAGHRASTTRLLSEVGAAVEATPPNPEDLSHMKVRLNEKLTTLKQLDAEIVELTPEADLDTEIIDTDEYNSKILRNLARIDRALSSSTSPPQTLPSATAAHSMTNKVKLPKLSLPKFGGNLFTSLLYTTIETYPMLKS